MPDNYYATAANAFQKAMESIPQSNPGLYHLAFGLRRLAEGLQLEADAVEKRLTAIEEALQGR